MGGTFLETHIVVVLGRLELDEGLVFLDQAEQVVGGLRVVGVYIIGWSYLLLMGSIWLLIVVTIVNEVLVTIHNVIIVVPLHVEIILLCFEVILLLFKYQVMML